MSKSCPSGHQIEDSWEVCPYCQNMGYAVKPAPLPKTRLESDTPSPAGAGAGAAAQPASGPRKTVLISDKRKAPVVGWLVAMNGEQKGDDFRIREGVNTVGNAPGAEILLRDDTVSSKHASIRYQDGKFILTDLDSTNGTFLNDSQSTVTRSELKDNDTIRIGEITLKFKCL